MNVPASGTAREVVASPGTLTSAEKVARDHFQKTIDYLEKSFDLATQAEDQARVDEILGKIFLSMFTVTGSCKKRGFCCRNFTLFTSSGYLKSQEDFEVVCEQRPDWRIFEYKESDGEYAYFTCSKLNEATGLCSIHDERPQVCRDYPHSNLPQGRAPDIGCGYKYRARFFLPRIKDRALLDRVASLLVQMQRWHDAAHLYDVGGHPIPAAVLRAQDLADREQYESAIEALEEAEQKEPENSEVLECLALCHLKLAEQATGDGSKPPIKYEERRTTQEATP